MPFASEMGLKGITWGEAFGLPSDSDSKESACNVGDQIRSLGREDPLEKGMATHFSILAWRITWMEEPGELLSGVTKSQTPL